MIKKISPRLVEEAIMAEAKAIKRKKEIFSELKKFEEELSALNEVGMVGSFGFEAPGDRSSVTKTGFVGTQELSYVKQLMDEFQEEAKTDENIDAEAAKALKEENESLKTELEALKKKLTPAA